MSGNAMAPLSSQNEKMRKFSTVGHFEEVNKFFVIAAFLANLVDHNSRTGESRGLLCFMERGDFLFVGGCADADSDFQGFD